VTEGLSFINTYKISFLVRFKNHKMVDYHKYRRRKAFEAMLSVFARIL
jgi:hypothetical protein